MKILRKLIILSVLTGAFMFVAYSDPPSASASSAPCCEDCIDVSDITAYCTAQCGASSGSCYNNCRALANGCWISCVFCDYEPGGSCQFDWDCPPEEPYCRGAKCTS